MWLYKIWYCISSHEACTPAQGQPNSFQVILFLIIFYKFNVASSSKRPHGTTRLKMFTKRRSQRETLLNGKNSINNNTVILLAQTKLLFSVRMNCFVLYCILISKHLLKKNKKQKNKQKKPPPPTKNPPELMLYSFLLKKFLLCSFCVILILYHRN